MKKSVFYILLCALLTLHVSLFASNTAEPNFAQTIANKFSMFWTNYPQEKLYLQTDKPYYSAGDNIWIKGYLVNSMTHEPNALSQFIYVELIDKFDSVMSRVKIKKDSLGFSGYLNLKPDIPSGSYELRSYSYWMQNNSKDFFFKKNIYIGNLIDDRISSKITYGNPINGLVPVSIIFSDASKKPIVAKKVEITQNWGNTAKKKNYISTNEDGLIKWQIAVDPKNNSEKRIEVSINDEKYKNTFFLPEFNTDFDLQFFPESGVLLDNCLQTIGFKAIGKDGLSVPVAGKVFSNKNEEISEFTALNKGMGKISIQTQPNESYYALIRDLNGVEKRFELPKPESKGIIIQLGYNRGKISYKVVNQTNIPNKSLYLLLHSRGKVLLTESLKLLENRLTESLLPPGIVTFSVIDSLGHLFCERLSFIRTTTFPTISMKSKKKISEKRKLLNLEFNIQSKLQKTVNDGTFSISVTDSRVVKLDSLEDNILSNILLSSDIKGYIEDPSSYFADNKMLTREKTDVLMLTQGWTRFSTCDIINGVYQKPAYYLEEGQAISGKVLNLFNKPSKNCEIMLISPYKNIVKISKTDNNGRYLIDGIEFPDSTIFILKAKKTRSLTDVEIVVDSDKFIKPKEFIPSFFKTNISMQDEYLKQSKEKYFAEGGMRIINLGEVTIKANKKAGGENNYYSKMADEEINSERLEKYPNTTILNFLYTIPGIQVAGEGVSIRGSLGNPLFLVDDVEMQIEDISYLTTNDIQNIEVFKDANAAIFGLRGGNGVIAIKLKYGVDLKAKTPISLAHISPLGYQKPAQFYIPKYDVDSIFKSSKPDLRSTIYWNSELKPDNNGVIHVQFYTADNDNNYSIVLEGITNSGEVCRYVGNLNRTNNN